MLTKRTGKERKYENNLKRERENIANNIACVIDKGVNQKGTLEDKGTNGGLSPSKK